MNDRVFAINDETRLVRVYKSSIARKCFDHNLPVLFCPVNMDPTNKYFNMAVWIRKTEEQDNFQKAVNAFEYYNCNHETGYYTAFYIPQCRTDRFSSERKKWHDTVNTNITYDYKYMQERGILK